MEESTYWNRVWKRRMSRRRLITGAALTGSGLAAAAVVGCGGGGTDVPGGNGNDNPFDDGADLEEFAVDPYDARREFTPPPAGTKPFGFLRYQGFDSAVIDRYDPHQTQFGPMYANQSSVFSKLYMYKSHREPTWENIVPDLAAGIPEMIGDPEAPTEYVVKLKPGVKFHDTPDIRKNFPKLAGRELTAEDVVYSYLRQQNQDSPQRGYYYRASQYRAMEKVEATDKYTIKLTSKGPIAPFYHFMADTNAFIVPKEVVDNSDDLLGKPWDSIDTGKLPEKEKRMIGTGPFLWGELSIGIRYKAIRNPEWFGWDDPDMGRPYLEGYIALGSDLNDVNLESNFRQKKIDVAGFIDNPDWVFNMKRDNPELEYIQNWVSGWIGTRFKTHCAPYSDPKVRKAIHLATERQEIVDVIGKRQWKMQGPVGGAIGYWALPEEELLAAPGYRQDVAGRDKDLADALALFEAAGKPELPEVWFANLPGYIPTFVGTWKAFMSANLGIPIEKLRHREQSYQIIAENLTKEECGDNIAMYWGFDNGWIDLDDWVYPYFHSTGSKNSFRVNDKDLDVLLDAQRKEFDYQKRLQLGYQIQRYMLGLQGDGLQKGAHARIDYAAPFLSAVSWPYYKNRVAFPWFGSSYWFAETWLDQKDASLRGRPGGEL